MSSGQLDTIAGLLGEDFTGDPLGEDLQGSLIAGYQPERNVLYVPNLQLGDGLAGPPNDQPLAIYRDTRPLAVDELGMQGPFTDGPKLARHRAGRSLPLNYDYGAWFDTHLPGRAPAQDVRRMSPLAPGGLPAAHEGMHPPEVLPPVETILYTTTPQVGWTGY